MIQMELQENRHRYWHKLINIAYVFVVGLLGGVFWIVVSVVGIIIYMTQAGPWNVVVGWPMAIIGWTLICNTIWSDILVFFSSRFEAETCIICSMFKPR